MQYVSTIRELVERGKARRPDLAARIERAAFIALFRRVEPRPDGAWLVESDAEIGRFHTVHGGCDCPDRAPSNLCKHVLAVALLRAAHDREHARRVADDRVALALAEAAR